MHAWGWEQPHTKEKKQSGYVRLEQTLFVVNNILHTIYELLYTGVGIN